MDETMIVTALFAKKWLTRLVNNQLSGYPWGGEVIDMHKNEWGEWIADCHIWGQYGSAETGHYYTRGDADCPVTQMMVQPMLDWKCRDSECDAELWVRLWRAKDDKRLPTLEESRMVFDEYAPSSPYIVEPIKAYLEEHKDDDGIFPF